MGTDAALRQAAAWAEQWGMFPRGCLALCAVSGGRDSMVLLRFLYELGREQGFSVACAHFNHHLRPTAGRDEDFVRTWAGEHGIPCRIGGGDVAAYCAGRGLSIEEGARQLRYAFLEEARRDLGADVIATGHHLADQAETVLLNLVRGTGLEGLRGIAAVKGRLVRPLLTTAPEELAAYAAAHSLPYVEDESNRDLAYSRNRLRAQVLPVLRELNGAALENIHRAACTAAETAAWCREEAHRRLRELGDPIPYAAFRAQPLMLRKEQVRLLLGRLPAGLRDVTAGQITAAADLGRGGYLQLPGGIYAAAEGGVFTVGVQTAPPPPVPLPALGTAAWGGWLVSRGEEGAGETLRLPIGEDAEEVTLGPWDPSGRMETPTGRRSMKRIFADHRIPVSRREEYPVVYAGGQALAILSVTPGCPPGCRAHKNHLVLRWKKTEKKENNEVWKRA